MIIYYIAVILLLIYLFSSSVYLAVGATAALGAFIIYLARKGMHPF